MNREKFIEELKKLNVNIDNRKLEQLEKYYELLESENKLYNLTSITNLQLQK